MSILNTIRSAPTVTPAATQDRTPATLWLNIGADFELVRDGQTVTEFISMPVGIPLDTTEHMVAKGKSPEWHQMVACKNAILDAVLGEANSCKAGEGKFLSGLKMQVYKKADQSEIEPTVETPSLVSQLKISAA